MHAVQCRQLIFASLGRFCDNILALNIDGCAAVHSQLHVQLRGNEMNAESRPTVRVRCQQHLHHLRRRSRKCTLFLKQLALFLSETCTMRDIHRRLVPGAPSHVQRYVMVQPILQRFQRRGSNRCYSGVRQAVHCVPYASPQPA